MTPLDNQSDPMKHKTGHAPEPHIPHELAQVVRAGVQTPDGPLVVPTLDELIRIKAFLAYERNYMRDYLDLAELTSVPGEDAAVSALSVLDEKLGWEKQPLVLGEVMKALLLCKPRDLDTCAYDAFRWLNPKLKSWAQIETVCKSLGRALSVRKIIEEDQP